MFGNHAVANKINYISQLSLQPGVPCDKALTNGKEATVCGTSREMGAPPDFSSSNAQPRTWLWLSGSPGRACWDSDITEGHITDISAYSRAGTVAQHLKLPPAALAPHEGANWSPGPAQPISSPSDHLGRGTREDDLSPSLSL